MSALFVVALLGATIYFCDRLRTAIMAPESEPVTLGVLAGAVIVLVIVLVTQIARLARARRAAFRPAPLRSFNLATLEPPKGNSPETPATEAAPPPAPGRPNPLRVRLPNAPAAAPPEAIVAKINPPAVTPPPPRSLSSADIVRRLRAIDWLQLQRVVALLYEKLGCTVSRSGPPGAFGNADMLIDIRGDHKMVRCLKPPGGAAGETVVRDFGQHLAAANVAGGILIVIGGCTNAARLVAEQGELETLDEEDVTQMLLAVGAQFDPIIMGLIEDDRKFCPKCEAELVLKPAAATGPVWSCSAHPRCDFTLQPA